MNTRLVRSCELLWVLYFEINISPAQNEQYYFSISQIANIYNYADITKPEDAQENDTSFTEDIGIAFLKGSTEECPFDNETINNIAKLFLEDLDYQNYGLTKNDVTYSYKFATTSKRLHSNADVITYNGTYYTHTWNFNQDEEGNIVVETLKFYNTYLNTIVWYWIGLGVTVIGGIIVTIVLYSKNKPKKTDKIIISD